MTDAELLDRSLHGDEDAFLRLYRRYSQRLFGLAMRSTGLREEAEDVTHDTFLALLERPSGFDSSRGELRLYLFGIARNLIRKKLRKRSRATPSHRGDDVPAPAADPQHAVMKNEVADLVRRAVFQLPPLQREALILFQYQGLSLRDISRITGDGVEAVKQRLFRARQSLRRELAELIPPDEGRKTERRLCHE